MWRPLFRAGIGLMALASSFPRGSSPETPRTVNVERVVLPQGANHTIRVDGLRRVAIGNPKVARARAVPPDGLLLTAVSKGITSVHTWSKSGKERAFVVEVRIVDLARNPAEKSVRVALDFLEISAQARQQFGVEWPDRVGMSPSGILPSLAWVRMLVQQGNAKLLASPELHVRLGEEAAFSSGGEIAVPAASENFGRVQRQIEWKPYGIAVKVKPESTDSYHFQSEIQVELSELNASQAIAGIPGVSKRKLSTKVSSVEGETVLLSGLVRQIQSSLETGIPVLKDIPVLGYAFSAPSHSQESTEILMAVTVTLPTRLENSERWESFEMRRHQP